MSPSASSRPASLLYALRDDCPAIAERNLLELLGVITGFKNVVRLTLNDSDWPALIYYCDQLRLHVARSTFKIALVRTTPLGDRFTTNVAWDDPRGYGFIAYVAQSLDVAEAAEAIEAVDGEEYNVRTGTLYQYPRCCMEAYRDIEGGTYWVESIARRSSGSQQNAYANKFAYLFDGGSLFPDYFPCSLSCDATARLGRSYFSLLHQHGMGQLADSLLERMSRPVILGRGIAYQLNCSTRIDDRIVVNSEGIKRHAWSTDAEEVRLDEGGLIVLESNGPWIMAQYKGVELGTLFLFDQLACGSSSTDRLFVASPKGVLPC